MRYLFYKRKNPEIYYSDSEKCYMQKYSDLNEVFKISLEEADYFTINHIYRYEMLEKNYLESSRKIKAKKLYCIGYYLLYEEEKKEYHKESWIKLFKYYLERLGFFYILLPKKNSQKFLEYFSGVGGLKVRKDIIKKNEIEDYSIEYFSGVGGLKVRKDIIKKNEIEDYSEEEYITIYGELNNRIKSIIDNIIMKEYFNSNGYKDGLELNLFNIKNQDEGSFYLGNDNVSCELTEEMHRQLLDEGFNLGNIIKEHHRVFCSGNLDDLLKKDLYLIEDFNLQKQEILSKEKKPYYTDITLYKRGIEIFKVQSNTVYICFPEKDKEKYKEILKDYKWEKYKEQNNLER